MIPGPEGVGQDAMCGIAGFVNREGEAADRGIVERMTATLAHRGPDGDGVHVSGPVALGHRRLSIIDVTGGAQPMSNEDGTVWVTYNGELYNELELRLELEAKGHRYQNQSDTESLVHLYEEEGVEFRQTAQRDVRPGPLGPATGPAGPGAGPDGTEAPLPRPAARGRTGVRLRAQGDPPASRCRPGPRPRQSARATSSTSTSPRLIPSGEGCASFPAPPCWSGRRAQSGQRRYWESPDPMPEVAERTVRGGLAALLGDVSRRRGAASPVGCSAGRFPFRRR